MIQSNLKVEETIKQASTKCYTCVLWGDYLGYNQPSEKPLKWCWPVISCDIGSDLVVPWNKKMNLWFVFLVFPAFTLQNKRFQNVTRKTIREDNTCKTMGGQIKLKNNEAFALSGCLARLAQSKVFQDLKIVCQVLCISCLAKAFKHGMAVFDVQV